MKNNSPISEGFRKLLDALQSAETADLHPDITFQIYYDLFKIREAQWKYKGRVNRGVDYQISDIFQDIIAHYLRRFLPGEYSVYLEHKIGKLRPDILVKKDGANWSIIEVKTTIGWNRDLVQNENYLERLKKLACEFNVNLERVFYIFESASNVGKDFPTLLRTDKLMATFILPLFKDSPAPYYIAKRDRVVEFSDDEIYARYQDNRYTDFIEGVVKKLTA